MNVRKPIIYNLVYSEILIKLADGKKTATELLSQFENERKSNYLLDKPKIVYDKSQPALREQLLHLKKEGYVGLIEEKEKGKNFEHNKKKFYVRWEKIIEDFLLFCEDNLKKEGKNRYGSNAEEYFKEYKKNIEKKKDKFIKNKIIHSSFETIFDLQRRFDRITTLSDLFNDMLQFNLFERVYKDLLEKLNLAEMEFKDREIYEEKLPKILGDNASLLLNFEEFVGLNPAYYKIERFDGLKDGVVSDIIKRLWGEDKWKNDFIINQAK